MLIAVGAAFDGSQSHNGDHKDFGDRGGDRHDFGGHGYYDWLNPGGYYSYSYWYPTYYSYSYPAYTYTYPTYYYTAPVVYPTYSYYYDPVVYDPWYATNVYGWGGATYYYSNSWSWSTRGGFYF
ncbi:MAG: hypothetical protein JW999_08910 [Methanotrichaceae archaeon]|nr:hypothetical protein [Methanotrichaceae archaeon]